MVLWPCSASTHYLINLVSAEAPSDWHKKMLTQVQRCIGLLAKEFAPPEQPGKSDSLRRSGVLHQAQRAMILKEHGLGEGKLIRFLSTHCSVPFQPGACRWAFVMPHYTDSESCHGFVLKMFLGCTSSSLCLLRPSWPWPILHDSFCLPKMLGAWEVAELVKALSPKCDTFSFYLKATHLWSECWGLGQRQVGSWELMEFSEINDLKKRKVKGNHGRFWT